MAAHSQCRCGEPFRIVHEPHRTARTDGNRIVPVNAVDGGQCQFRCPSCSEPVDESVPGAEHETPTVEAWGAVQ